MMPCVKECVLQGLLLIITADVGHAVTTYNEYIVYNEAQLKLRYIVILKDIVQ